MKENKLKEKFKKLDKKGKIFFILEKIFLGILICICIAIGINILIARNCTTAGAEYVETKKYENNEMPNIMMPLKTKGAEINEKIEVSKISSSIQSLPTNSAIIITYFKPKESIRINSIRITKLETKFYTNSSEQQIIGRDENGNNIFEYVYNVYSNVIKIANVNGEEAIRGGIWLSYVNVNYLNSNIGEGEGYDLVKEYRFFWRAVDKTNLNLIYENAFKEGQLSPNSQSYREGYNEGYQKGISESSINPIGMIIQPVAQMFSIKMFGAFSIGDFFTVALFVSVALIFLKIFAGG